jgi:Polyketide cyclase / dehydrase and lipid transport
MNGRQDAVPTELVVCTGIVAAPLEVVWDLVSDFGGVGRWSVGPVNCTVDGAGVGAVRTVERGDQSVRERLEHWDATDHSLTYSFPDELPLPVERLVETIAVRGGDVSEITWSAWGDVGEDDRAVVCRILDRFFTRRIGELQAIAPQRVAEPG